MNPFCCVAKGVGVVLTATCLLGDVSSIHALEWNELVCSFTVGNSLVHSSSLLTLAIELLKGKAWRGEWRGSLNVLFVPL